MKRKEMDQRCTTTKVLGNGNWEDYMWPHQIDKTPRLDTDFLAFLTELNLSKLTGIFENEEVLSMEVVMSLNEEHLKDIGIKLGDRIIILKETSKLRKQPAVGDQGKTKTSSSESSISVSPPSVKSRHELSVKPQEKTTKSPASSPAVTQQPKNVSPEAKTKSQVSSPPSVKQQLVSDPIFLLVSSSGSAADHQSDMMGFYRKTEEMREGRSVYRQMHNTKYGNNSRKIFINKGVWSITYDSTVYLRAATPSDSPISTKCQYLDRHKTWREDPALTVTSLSDKPDLCEVTISLSEDVKRELREPGVEGVYKADGSYCRGRPVLQHVDGRFTLYLWAWGWWRVKAGVGDEVYLESGSAPSQCPADPRAARDELKWQGQKHWKYGSKSYGVGWRESTGISVRCKTHLI